MSAIFSESLDFWVTQRTSIHDPSSTAAPGRTSALPEVPTTAIVRYGHLPAFPSKMCIDVSVYVIFVYNKYGIVCMCVCILYIYDCTIFYVHVILYGCVQTKYECTMYNLGSAFIRWTRHPSFRSRQVKVWTSHVEVPLDPRKGPAAVRLPPSNSQWIGLTQNLHRKPWSSHQKWGKFR